MLGAVDHTATLMAQQVRAGQTEAVDESGFPGRVAINAKGGDASRDGSEGPVGTVQGIRMRWKIGIA
jgi:hypothetical protein